MSTFTFRVPRGSLVLLVAVMSAAGGAPAAGTGLAADPLQAPAASQARADRRVVRARIRIPTLHRDEVPQKEWAVIEPTPTLFRSTCVISGALRGPGQPTARQVVAAVELGGVRWGFGELPDLSEWDRLNEVPDGHKVTVVRCER